MPKRFCAICGKDIDETAPHFGMCLDCYLKEHPLFELPKNFNLRICNYCGKFSKKENWIQSDSYEPLDIIIEAIKKLVLQQIKNESTMEFSIIPEENYFNYSSRGFLVNLNLKILGSLIKNPDIYGEQILPVKVSYEYCKNCTNLKSGTFFTSILQLRANLENFEFLNQVINNITDFVEKLFEKDEKQYISNIDKQKNGFDLYLSTNELLNHIISFMKSSYDFGLKRTKKLVGRDHHRGKNIYRLKAVIRFLPFNKNDYIIIDNQTFYVESIKKNSVILRDKSEKRFIKDFDFFFTEKVIVKNVKEGAP
jgi:NMD protein affecting ribosome stability and mRNA decay